MNEEEPNCWTCAYSNLPDTAEPCASCDMYFSHFESTEPTEATTHEDARREAKMAGPTCLTCKHKGVSIEEEPCISCNGYQNYTPDESAPCAEGTDENDDVIEPCNTCTHRDNLRCNPPCSHCRRERGIEYPEYEEAEDKEKEIIMRPSCDTCKYKNLDKSVEPCHSCSYDRFGNPMNYVGATEAPDCSTCKHRTSKPTEPPCADCFDCDRHEQGTKGPVGPAESGVKGIMPQHIVDMFAERVKQAALRFVNECNAHPRPCPYCGEIPEVVGETIYPGEEHCYVVCNGAKLLPHSISIHGRTREEAVARWNSFALSWISERK